MSRLGRLGRLGTLVGGLVAVASLAGACSGGDDPTTSDITLPSSLSVPATTPDHGGVTTTTGATTSSTSEVPPTNPAPDGAPVITDLIAEPGADSCTDGTIPAVISFAVAPQPPVRVFSVFLDGQPAGASNEAAPITVSVPCDGEVHLVLFIATDFDARSSTEAVSFRAPQAS
jgi:hypothetical protein